MVCDYSLYYIHDLVDRFSAMYLYNLQKFSIFIFSPYSPYLAYCSNNKENLMAVKNPSEE